MFSLPRPHLQLKLSPYLPGSLYKEESRSNDRYKKYGSISVASLIYWSKWKVHYPCLQYWQCSLYPYQYLFPNSHQISFLNKNSEEYNRDGWSGVVILIALEVDSTSRSTRPPLQLQAWFTKADLFDVWRCYHATERDYTFYSHAHTALSSIDMFLADRDSLQLVDKCEIGTISWSDHALPPLNSTPTRPLYLENEHSPFHKPRPSENYLNQTDQIILT